MVLQALCPFFSFQTPGLHVEGYFKPDSSLCLLCVSVKKLVRCLSGFTFHILTLTASSNKRSHGIFHAALLSFVTWPI